MRPTKLTIQGLTAYKQQVEVDFTDLDLFAITGPTGAGKSSLVDAITFALFGKAPRVGREIKELISQGENALKVELYFSTNGNSYRIHRTTAHKGKGKIQFELFDSVRNEWMAEESEDRAKEANAAVERAIHMDYDTFVRTVLLPQGEFQKFLAGDPNERRKVLDGLLQLNVYAAMQQKANAIDRDKTAEADAHRHRLDNELADATPEALKSVKSQLKELKTRATELATLRDATDAAYRTAEALSQARTREREARGKFQDSKKAFDAAAKLLAEGKLVLAGMDAQIAKAGDEIKAAEYDVELHLRLTKCLPLLSQIEDRERREEKLTREIEAHAPDVEKARAEVEAAKKKLVAARDAAQAKQDAYETARHTNATALLRQKLKKGDPCPVCGQAAPELPKVQAVVLDKLKAAYGNAKADETRANENVGEAEKRLVKEETGAKAGEKQLAELRGQGVTLAKQLASVIDEPGLKAAAVELRIAALEKAKTQKASLEDKRTALIAERDAEAKAMESARTDVTRLDIEAKAHDIEAARSAKDAATATTAIADAAKHMAWDDVKVALEGGRDVAVLLRGRLVAAQEEERDANQGIGAAGKQIEHIETAIETAKVLREHEKTCREEATQARNLASLLRADRFPAFLRERAMKVLADAGSEKLREVSGGRYDLKVKEQDFEVEDVWNANMRRPVRTLSGGETFLASLALALALAEHLPALAGNGQQNTLESLFIDEGFSHLDAETLDIVASALEVLGQDRRRLIGVVTHVPALAERMPARITVHKSQGGSTLTVE